MNELNQIIPDKNMDDLTGTLDKLVAKSRHLLSEIEKPDPDMDAIESILTERSYIIGDLQRLTGTETLTGKDSRLVDDRIQMFRMIHQKTDSVLQQKFKKQESLLGKAARSRKAEFRYQKPATPDISYISDL